MYTHIFICIFKFRQRVYEATVFMDRRYISFEIIFQMLLWLWKQPSLSSCISPWLYTTSLLTPPLCSHHPLLTLTHTISLLTYSHHLLIPQPPPAYFPLTPPCSLLSHHLLLTPPPCSHHLCCHQMWGWRFPHQQSSVTPNKCPMT